MTRITLDAATKYLLWKLTGILLGAVAGASLGGNALVWLGHPDQAWKVVFPSEGIITGVGGVLLGGTLAGGRVGALGVCLLAGTAAGVGVGYALEPHPKVGLFVIGAIAGLLAGLVVGLLVEVARARRVAAG